MASVTSISSNATSATTGHASWTTDADTATISVSLTGAGTNTISNLTGTSCDFGSLVPSSTYTVHVTPTNSSGVNGTTATSSFTTPAASPAVLNIVSIGQTGAQFYISNLTYIWDTAQYSNAYVTISGVGTSAPVYAPPPVGSGHSTSFGNITGLSAGTSYTATGFVVTSGGSTVNVGSVSFTTTQNPPSGLTGLTATGNNGYVHLSWNVSSGATSYDISWTGGSSGSSSTSSTTSDVMGLTNGASYTFTVTPRNSGGTGSSQSASATPNNRPTNFSFQFSTISSGSNAIVDNRDWNNLSSKILAFRLYKSVGSYTFTQVTSSTGSITAALFNELVNGCSVLIPYMTNNVMPTTKSIGNDFYASYLSNIVTSINSIS